MKQGVIRRWGAGPLAVYALGILLPCVCAAFREDLLLLLGVPAFAILFWTGPFASAASVAWSGWSLRWRVFWILLIPLMVGAIFALLFVVVL